MLLIYFYDGYSSFHPIVLVLSYCNVFTYDTSGKYWGKIAKERRKKPYSILLADKNAPSEEVWKQVYLCTLLPGLPPTYMH